MHLYVVVDDEGMIKSSYVCCSIQDATRQAYVDFGGLSGEFLSSVWLWRIGQFNVIHATEAGLVDSLDDEYIADVGVENDSLDHGTLLTLFKSDEFVDYLDELYIWFRLGWRNNED